MYEVGQIVNIGYYGGFQNRTLIKTQAEITEVDKSIPGIWVKAEVRLHPAGHRNMFGYAYQLQCMEENYCK